MNELQKIAAKFRAISNEGQAARSALATVIRVKGSAYRRPGARMLVAFNENGNAETAGTISGGCLESDCIERAKRAIETGMEEIAFYDSSENADRMFGTQTGCGGAVEILIEPVSNPHTFKFLEFLAARSETRTAGAAATVIADVGDFETGRIFRSQELFFVAGEHLEWEILNREFLSDVEASLRGDFRSQIKSYGIDKNSSNYFEIFLETIQPAPSLVICGAGDDTQPLAKFASETGWHTVVFDHREVFANRERFLLADEIIIARPETILEKINFDTETFAVLMTHNYDRDFEFLRRLLASDCGYIGCLGTKKRTGKMLVELREMNGALSYEQTDKIYAPVGLDTGAETPEEIAISILAEIRAVRSNRAGGHLRDAKCPVHDSALDKIKTLPETTQILTPDEVSLETVFQPPKIRTTAMV